MTKTFIFCVGPGHLDERAEVIAKRYNVVLYNTTDLHCRCGRGCRPGTCRLAKVHWFAAPDHGDPFNRQLAKWVEADLEHEGVIY